MQKEKESQKKSKMLLKELKVECPKCGWFDVAYPGMNDWDKLLEIEDCPNCLEKIAEEI